MAEVKKKIAHQPPKGFTLIELLIVIAILAILATATFVALDPLTKFKNARDTRRRTDISSLINAIKINQVDNQGSYLSSIANLGADSINMIGTDTANCDSFNAFCDTSVSLPISCADFTGLVSGGYLGSVPISPNGAGGWTSGHTGYTIQRSSANIIKIRSCESENNDEILISQ